MLQHLIKLRAVGTGFVPRTVQCSYQSEQVETDKVTEPDGLQHINCLSLLAPLELSDSLLCALLIDLTQFLGVQKRA